MRKEKAQKKMNEAGGWAVASHYRGAARLAWFMRGSQVGINHDGRAKAGLPRLACEFPKP